MDYTHSLEASIYMEQQKAAFFQMYQNVYQKASDCDMNWLGKYIVQGVLRSVGALVMGVGLSLTTLVTKIATVCETLFKAFTAFLDGDVEYSAKHILAFFFATADLVIGCPLHMIWNLFVDTLGLAISPEDYSKFRMRWHEESTQLLNYATILEDATTHTSNFMIGKTKTFKINTVWDAIVFHWENNPIHITRNGIGCVLNGMIYGDSWAKGTIIKIKPEPEPEPEPEPQASSIDSQSKKQLQSPNLDSVKQHRRKRIHRSTSL